jgi:hypothetical protein
VQILSRGVIRSLNDTTCGLIIIMKLSDSWT